MRNSLKISPDIAAMAIDTLATLYEDFIDVLACKYKNMLDDKFLPKN